MPDNLYRSKIDLFFKHLTKKTMEFTKDWRIINDGIFGGYDDYQKIVGGCGFYNEEFPKLGFDLSGYASKENILLMSKALEMLEMLKELRNAILSEDYTRMLSSSQMAKKLIDETTTIQQQFKLS